MNLGYLKAQLPTMKRSLIYTSSFIALVVTSIFGQSGIVDPDPDIFSIGDGTKRAILHISEKPEEVILTQLLLGTKYGIFFNINEQELGGCVFHVTILDGITKTEFNESHFEYIPKNGTIHIIFDIPCLQPKVKYPLYFTIKCKDPLPKITERGSKINLIAVASNADHLINDIFLSGNCYDVQNVKSFGCAAGIGEFKGGSTSINIDDGVIIASGVVSNADGPDDTESKTGGCGGGGDPDLALLTSKPIFDAAGIEFDFYPTVPNLSFRYVFGSEEYNEFVCAPYSDVFGFFLSGPGINGGFSGGAINIATVPGQALYVGVNTVNNGMATPSPHCTPPLGSLGNSQYFVDNMNGPDIQYDGHTTIFEAKAIGLQTCKKYHIKLAVGDASDSAYDSGVFLEKGSFGTGPSEIVTIESPSTNSNVVYEACNDGKICFKKANLDDIGIDKVINWTIKSSSTATSGVDYVPFGNSVTIPAGEEFVCIPITVFKDALIEGQETIILNIENSCNCSQTGSTLIIDDTPPLEIELDDVYFCGDPELTTFNPKFIQNGVPKYSYYWSEPGSFNSDLTVFPQGSGGIYSVTVTDMCGQKAIADAEIHILQKPIAKISDEKYFCPNNPNLTDSLTIKFFGNGNGPWYLQYSIDDVPQPPITVTTNPYYLKVNKLGTYKLEEVYVQSGNFQCQGEVSGEGSVKIMELDPIIFVQDETCNGKKDGKVEVEDVLGGAPIFTYQWNKSTKKDKSLTGLSAGWYQVTITDKNGCTVMDSAEVQVPWTMEVNATILKHSDCLIDNGAVDISVTGGTPPYLYAWDNGATIKNPNNLSQGIHTVTITDVNGCQQYKTVPIQSPDAALVVPTVTQNVNCYNPQSGAIQLTLTGGNPGFQYQWDSAVPSTQQTNKDINNLSQGKYSVTITDAKGCKAYATAEVKADVAAPNVDAGNNTEVACGITSLNLNGSGSSIGSDYQYQWTTISGKIITGSNTLYPEVSDPGWYYLEVTNTVNGCKSKDSVLLFANKQAPSVTIDAPSPITCDNNTISLDASKSSQGGFYLIQWTTVGGNFVSGQNTLTPVVNQPGNYILSIIDTTNGCVGKAITEVKGNISKPVVVVQPFGLLDCENGLVSLDGAGSNIDIGTTYKWKTTNGSFSNSSNTNSLQVQVNQAGSYTLVVKSGLTGCTDSLTIEVKKDITPPEAGIAPPNNITCKEPIVTLTGMGSSQGSNYEYNWAPIQLSGHFVGPTDQFTSKVDVPGSYTIIVTNKTNKCKATANIVVGIDTIKPVAFIQEPKVLNCITSKISLSGIGSSTGPEYIYQWTSVGGSIEQGGNTISPLIQGEGTYTLEVTNQINGCKDKTTVNVTKEEKFPAVLIATPDPINCIKDQVVIDGSASEFNQWINFAWSTANGNIIGGATTATPTVNKGGQYTVTSTNSSNGCTTTKSVTVIEDKLKPIADAGGDIEITCLSQNGTLDGSNSSSGPDLIFQWSDTYGLPIAGGNEKILNITKPGTYQLKVINTKNGCFREDTVKVLADFLQDATIDMVEPLCFNQPGKMHVTNIYGGAPPFKYSIDGGQTFQNSPIFKKVFPGKYNLVIEDNTDCKLKKDFEIPFVNEILVAIDPSIRIVLGDKPILEAQVNIDPKDIKHVQWTPSYGLHCDTCLITGTEPKLTTDYLILIEDINGCKGQAKTRIIVEDPNIYIPNAFTPFNLDGFNDYFTIYTDEANVQEVSTLQIFDRWGEKLFQRDHFAPNIEQLGWNGMFKGAKMNPGVYTYYTNILLTNGTTIQLEGDVTIVD